MAKTLSLLFFLTLFAIAALWFAENDGSIVVEWLGYRIQTSVAIAMLCSLVFVVVCVLLTQIFIWIRSIPKRYHSSRREKRLNRGLEALTKGFAAIAAEDIKSAKSLAKKASNNLDNMPLTNLLAAQTAKLEGNKKIAQLEYDAVMANKETEIIAIKDLLLEAKEENDFGKALFLAEKAYSIKPDAAWVIKILIDLYKKMHKWQKVEEMLSKAIKLKIIRKEQANHVMALLIYIKYEEYPKHYNDNKAFDLIKEAHKLSPKNIPILVTYCIEMGKQNKIKKAAAALEEEWKQNPHPYIASAYMDLFSVLNDEKRLEKAERLLLINSSHPEAHVIVAKAALFAKQADKARQHLKIALNYGETRVVCNLMAELEALSMSGYEIVNSWHERAKFALEHSFWKCANCDHNSSKWHIICEKCNSFDSFKWQDATGFYMQNQDFVMLPDVV